LRRADEADRHGVAQTYEMLFRTLAAFIAGDAPAIAAMEFREEGTAHQGSSLC
jgi:hypothetical protein